MKNLYYKITFLFTGILLSSLSFAEDLTFSSAQVEQGEDLYIEFCQVCHGTQLDNGQFATPMKMSG